MVRFSFITNIYSYYSMTVLNFIERLYTSHTLHHIPCIFLWAGNDCGVFSCMVAYYLSSNESLLFDQKGIVQYNCRKQIALSILKTKAFISLPKVPKIEIHGRLPRVMDKGTEYKQQHTHKTVFGLQTCECLEMHVRDPTMKRPYTCAHCSSPTHTKPNCTSFHTNDTVVIPARGLSGGEYCILRYPTNALLKNQIYSACLLDKEPIELFAASRHDMNKTDRVIFESSEEDEYVLGEDEAYISSSSKTCVISESRNMKTTKKDGIIKEINYDTNDEKYTQKLQKVLQSKSNFLRDAISETKLPPILAQVYSNLQGEDVTAIPFQFKDFKYQDEDQDEQSVRLPPSQVMEDAIESGVLSQVSPLRTSTETTDNYVQGQGPNETNASFISSQELNHHSMENVGQRISSDGLPLHLSRHLREFSNSKPLPKFYHEEYEVQNHPIVVYDKAIKHHVILDNLTSLVNGSGEYVDACIMENYAALLNIKYASKVLITNFSLVYCHFSGLPVSNFSNDWVKFNNLKTKIQMNIH